MIGLRPSALRVPVVSLEEGAPLGNADDDVLRRRLNIRDNDLDGNDTVMTRSTPSTASPPILARRRTIRPQRLRTGCAISRRDGHS